MYMVPVQEEGASYCSSGCVWLVWSKPKLVLIRVVGTVSVHRVPHASRRPGHCADAENCDVLGPPVCSVPAPTTPTNWTHIKKFRGI
jgi:hypothetical protein